jgi:hypothetical protein
MTPPLVGLGNRVFPETWGGSMGQKKTSVDGGMGNGESPGISPYIRGSPEDAPTGLRILILPQRRKFSRRTINKAVKIL